jgi:modulator of FtsH protease
MHEWHDFFMAEVGASAALVGLLFVALSINIARIVEDQLLPGRALQSLIALITALLLASVTLFPIPTLAQLGLALLVIVAGSIFFSGRIAISQLAIKHDYHRLMVVDVALNAVFHACGATGALLLMLSSGTGLYWIAIAILYALCYGMLNAWVLLVEILR